MVAEHAIPSNAKEITTFLTSSGLGATEKHSAIVPLLAIGAFVVCAARSFKLDWREVKLDRDFLEVHTQVQDCEPATCHHPTELAWLMLYLKQAGCFQPPNKNKL